MRFYDREAEIAELRWLDDLAAQRAQLTVLMGRRRTGKTTLMLRALEGRPFLYFFVGKKSEKLQQHVQQVLGLHIHGEASSLAAILEEKVQHIKPHLRGYQIEIKGLSLEDM